MSAKGYASTMIDLQRAAQIAKIEAVLLLRRYYDHCEVEHMPRPVQLRFMITDDIMVSPNHSSM